MRAQGSILLASAAVAAAAAVASGCSGAPAAADRVAAATVPPPAPRAEVRGSAGWDAPPAMTATAATPEGFEDAASLRTWGYLEGDGGRTGFGVRGGALVVAPPRAAWSGRHRAFFLHRTIQGDFDVRTRVRVSAARTTAAQAGLLVRGAPPGGRPGEAWLSLATGREAGRRVVRLLDTRAGASRATSADGPAGWTRLRLRRRADLFEVFVGAPGGWTQTAAIQREDLPPALQVGVQASGGPHGAGARVLVDWVRFGA